MADIQPVDYGSLNNQPLPVDTFAQGYQQGHQIKLDRQADEDRQIQLDQTAQYNDHVNRVVANPTPANIAGLSLKYPQHAAAYKTTLDGISETQKTNQLKAMVPITSAIYAGKHDVAINLLNQEADAYDQSGNSDLASSTRAIAKSIEQSPQTAKFTIGSATSAIMGPEKFAQVFGEYNKVNNEQAKLPYEQRKLSAEADQAEGNLQKIPSEINKTNAEAVKAEADAHLSQISAENAPSKQEAENQKLWSDIETAKYDRKLKVIEGQTKLASTENDKQKLEVEKQKIISEKEERQAKLGGSVAERHQTVLDATNRATDLVNEIEKHPGLEKAVGTGSDLQSYFNSSDGADARRLIEQLKAVQFLTAVPGMKGLGALSNDEGKKLDAAISNLDTAQSVKAFRNALNISKKYLLQQQRGLIASKTLDNNNETFVGKDSQGEVITEGMINSMLTDHPGSTREQALSYLKSIGK